MKHVALVVLSLALVGCAHPPVTRDIGALTAPARHSEQKPASLQTTALSKLDRAIKFGKLTGPSVVAGKDSEFILDIFEVLVDQKLSALNAVAHAGDAEKYILDIEITKLLNPLGWKNFIESGVKYRLRQVSDGSLVMDEFVDIKTPVSKAEGWLHNLSTPQCAALGFTENIDVFIKALEKKSEQMP